MVLKRMFIQHSTWLDPYLDLIIQVSKIQVLDWQKTPWPLHFDYFWVSSLVGCLQCLLSPFPINTFCLWTQAGPKMTHDQPKTATFLLVTVWPQNVVSVRQTSLSGRQKGLPLERGLSRPFLIICYSLHVFFFFIKIIFIEFFFTKL